MEAQRDEYLRLWRGASERAYNASENLHRVQTHLQVVVAERDRLAVALEEIVHKADGDPDYLVAEIGTIARAALSGRRIPTGDGGTR